MKLNKSFVILSALAFCLAFAVDGWAQSQRKSPAPGAGRTSPAPDKTVPLPSNAVIQSLLKASLADFTGSVRAEDFTVLRDNASEDFKATFTVEQLKTIFQTFIDKKDLILPSLGNVSRTTAAFSTAPYIRTENGYKILVLKGAFPTKPYEVKFENEYELEDGNWKLLAIRVSL